jgi:anthranilate/para-aminobenzoate synthase component II
VRGLGVTIGAKAMIEAAGGNVVIVEAVKPGRLVAKK